MLQLLFTVVALLSEALKCCQPATAGYTGEHAARKGRWVTMEIGMRQAKFCFVPYGTSHGYGARYLPAVLFGCVPVFWQPNDKYFTLKPFASLPDVNWTQCSLTTDANHIERLHEELAAVTEAQVCTSVLWQQLEAPLPG